MQTRSGNKYRQRSLVRFNPIREGNMEPKKLDTLSEIMRITVAVKPTIQVCYCNISRMINAMEICDRMFVLRLS